jgi:6-carboxyhexanoate--CoA ligase
MLSIRMRASKKVKRQNSEVRSDDSKRKTRNGPYSEIHISGAEGLFEEREQRRVVREFIKRAMNHPRGKPDRVVVTVEKIGRTPLTVRTLPVTTLKSVSVGDSERAIKAILFSTGVSAVAAKKAFGVVYGEQTMRGAALVSAGSGRRLEPDRKRGVRAKCFGINTATERSLAAQLAEGGLNTATVKEALLLASKVASCRSVVAELCVSDDPDYTTGYVSTKSLGYVRIPRIKKKGERKGGRVFFIEDGGDIGCLIEFIEKTPVMIKGVSGYRGTRRIDEIIGCDNL